MKLKRDPIAKRDKFIMDAGKSLRAAVLMLIQANMHADAMGDVELGDELYDVAHDTLRQAFKLTAIVKGLP